MSNKEVYLYGGSGHGKVIKEIAKNSNINVVAFIDDNPKSNTLLNVPVFKTSQLEDVDNKQFVISIGNNKIRKIISKKLSKISDAIIDPSAQISDFVTIGKGTVVLPSVVINPDTNIGAHVILNTGAIIEHDCKIGDFVHISPNATITGGVSVGEGTHIGAGVIVIPGIKIGKWATIGAGTVIINDIPDYATVVGNPGRIIKYKKRNE
ncbi:UDP-N-acetylbacillosamine N-acetyltransferase [Tenacibaculum sp. 190524A02b]|uniref:UDP-N-acetylbacillosamine N-acetyltransferase n=1 Tax=Tenacibaculum vairaonense TaxID=3137860 RepID=A0ABP1F626_9FLAO